jgi:hypothetical protein
VDQFGDFDRQMRRHAHFLAMPPVLEMPGRLSGSYPRSDRETSMTDRPAGSGKSRCGGLEYSGDEVSSGNEGVLNLEAIGSEDLLRPQRLIWNARLLARIPNISVYWRKADTVGRHPAPGDALSAVVVIAPEYTPRSIFAEQYIPLEKFCRILEW